MICLLNSGFAVWLTMSNSEGVLLTHPSILDAGVIGVHDPDNLNVENPRAYVVRRPGMNEVNEADITPFSRGRWLGTRI